MKPFVRSLIIWLAIWPLALTTAALAQQPTFVETVHLGQYGSFRGMRWSPDGTMLAVATVQGVILYSDRLEFIRFLEAPCAIDEYTSRGANELAWSPDSARLAAINRYDLDNNPPHYGVEYAWDVRTGTLLNILHYEGGGGGIDEVAWSPSGDRLVGIFHMGLGEIVPYSHFLIWDVGTGELLASTEYSETNFEHLSWRADGRTFSAFQDSLSVTFDAATGEIDNTAPIYVEPHYEISPDGRLKATYAPLPILLNVMDSRTNQTLSSFPSFGQGLQDYAWWQAAYWLPDSRRILGILSPSQDNYGPHRAVLFDATSGEKLSQFDFGEPGEYEIWELYPSGRWLAVGGDPGRILLFNTSTGEVVKERLFDDGFVQAITWSPDSRKLATGGRSIGVWDAQTGELVQLLDHDRSLTEIAWSPDGAMIVGSDSPSSPSDAPPALLAWDVTSGVLLHSFALDAASQLQIGALTWGENGHTVKVVLQNPLKLLTWDINSGQSTIEDVPLPISDAGQLRIQFYDGQKLIAWVNERLWYWDLQAPERHFALDMPLTESSYVSSMTLRPDGRFLAVIDSLGRLAIWDTRLDQSAPISVTETFEHAAVIQWNPGGHVLAISGAAPYVAIWSVSDDGRSASNVQGLPRERISTWSLMAWSPDGIRLAQGGLYDPITIWQESAP